MLLAPLVWGVTIATAVLFALRPWWFPAGISRYAVDYDTQFQRTLLVTGIAFVLVQAALGWFILRYRDRGRSARHVPGGAKAEAVWTAVTAALFLVLVVTGTRIFASVQLAPPPGDAMKVEVLGRQFAWNFRYPGPDGKFGRTSLEFVNDAAGNPFGLDPKDTAGRDDVVSASLKVPVGRPVTLVLHSRDVIHSLFVRELRIKQDLVPGMEIPLQIRAESTGVFEIACAELCGLGHHQMRSTLEVMPAAAFAAWLARKK
jgi:cytochrome c oxidase subunit II